jgi:hypothetical protein
MSARETDESLELIKASHVLLGHCLVEVAVQIVDVPMAWKCSEKQKRVSLLEVVWTPTDVPNQQFWKRRSNYNLRA